MGKLYASRSGVAFATLLCAFLFAFSSANASTVFNITGNASLSGTLTIDTVAGDILAADIAVTGVSPDFTNFLSADQASSLLAYIANGTVEPGTVVTLQIEDGGTLVGFTGGAISFAYLGILCDFDSHFCRGTGRELGEAALTTESAAAPLPSALPLFGSVLAGVGIFGWRRRKRLSIRA